MILCDREDVLGIFQEYFREKELTLAGILGILSEILRESEYFENVLRILSLVRVILPMVSFARYKDPFFSLHHRVEPRTVSSRRNAPHVTFSSLLTDANKIEMARDNCIRVHRCAFRVSLVFFLSTIKNSTRIGCSCKNSCTHLKYTLRKVKMKI